jgi:hypothetical protein
MKNPEELMYEIEKRIKTTMIGSLAKFEETFGYLWEENGPDQNMYEDMWEETRNNILNHGNHQIRSAMKDLANYLHDKNFKYNNKYHYKFYI